MNVTETYADVDTNGLPGTKENNAIASTVVSLHDSAREVALLARTFLLEFSDSTIRDPDFVVRNFTDVTDLCPFGRANEFSDVVHNRQHFRINAFSVGTPAISIDFKDTCHFGSGVRRLRGSAGGLGLYGAR